MNRTTVYDTDILEWSEQQAATLRGLARIQHVLPNELDLEHIAEEIEDVGRSELASAQSFIREILVHLIKTVSVPDSEAMMHWRKEVVGFHNELLGRLTPSMLTRIDLPVLWHRATKEAEAALAAHGQRVAPLLPSRCPIEIHDIVDPRFDFFEAMAIVRKQIDQLTP